MNRQLTRVVLAALLISLPLSFMPTMTTREVVARLQGDWAGDVKAYDEVHQQILHMADGLSMGIINQFPKKFE